MTEYKETVRRQAKLLAAEEWAQGVKGIHAHGLNSMWYDNRPQDTSEGKTVIDVEYNNGLIERKRADGVTVYFGKKLEGNELIYEYEKAGLA